MKYFLVDFSELFVFLGRKDNRIPLGLLIVLCFNLFLAPVVQASTPGDTPRWQAYTIGLLGLAIASLSIYLFVVIFQPERF
ncbi:potassium-transporting ATPase subunit F [Calothrix sp. UHCC 0171]|uniref:potassium-transporting ATPase subunit F n=1 Tax=Calothrix sp. UHCC 0171 TaxID=3110245 RepID=UPI002B21B093|nr:potassium-transporting ATPase subunit F [Calothrix sp. UHCC 0171]MEA5573610.1 potassium-transporting ATPase subunit F [Calothrix sp. UHCC 0171]